MSNVVGRPANSLTHLVTRTEVTAVEKEMANLEVRRDVGCIGTDK